MKRVNFIQTNSVVYRWVLKGKEKLFPDGILPADWFLHLLHAREGKIFMLDDVMAVYRRHPGSLWNGDNFYLRNGIPHLRFCAAVKKEFGWNDDVMINDLALRTFSAFMKSRSFGNVNNLFSEFPELAEVIDNNMVINIPSSNKNRNNEFLKIKKRRRELLFISLFLLLVLIDLYLLFVCLG